MFNKENSYVLAPFVRVGFSDGILFVGFGSIQKKITDQIEQKVYLDLAASWKSPHTVSEIREIIKDAHPGAKNEPIIDSIISKFIEGNFLIENGFYNRDYRFSRHQLFYALSGADPLAVQKKLEGRHVAVLGSGGIGNLVAISLATLGIKKLTLVDGDTIELSNLSRQIMFTESDEGKHKVEVLKSAIKNRSSLTEIDIIKKPVSVEVLELLPKSIDLLVLSADTYGIQKWVNEYAIKNKIPYLCIGYIQDIAVYGPFVIPGKTACFSCQKLIVDNKEISLEYLDKIKKINEGYQAPSISPINMMATSHAMLDIVKHLGEFGEIHSINKRIGIWTDKFKVEEQVCIKNNACEVCRNVTVC